MVWPLPAPLNPSSPGTLKLHYPDPGTAQFSLGVQQQLQPAIVAILQYVGSIGWDQNDERNINTLPLNDLTHRQAVAGNSGLSNRYRIYSGYGGITQTESETNSNYNSLQAGLRIENKHGLTAQFSYTWSHEIDIASGDEGSTNFAGGQSYVSNPFNLDYDRGSGCSRPSAYLQRQLRLHTAVLQIVQSPYPHHTGRMGNFRCDHGGGRLASANLLQWRGYARLGGGTVNRPNVSGGTKGTEDPDGVVQDVGLLRSHGTLGRRRQRWLRQWKQGRRCRPGFFNWNIALFKSFALTSHEGPRFELRMETFNTFNHTEFQNLDLTLEDKNFGQATSTYDPRVLQFGGKFIF